MGKVIKFEVGCRGCANLLQVGKGEYVCDARVNMDDTSIYPILNGKRTLDWNMCEGEDYVLDTLKLHKKARTRSS